MLVLPRCTHANHSWADLIRPFRMALVLAVLSWAGGCASLPAQVERPVTRAFAVPEQTPLGELVHSRRTQARARSESGFHLLDSVDTAFTSRLALIESARRTLDLQYYAIHADASTEILLQRIREAARRGVRVRILLDDFNTVGEDAQVLRLAFEPGIALRLFNPLPGSRASLFTRIAASLHDVDRIQKRMHNKLFLADNAWGITGGRNLGDSYFGSGVDSNFIDLDVLVAGRVVRDMSASFDRYWNDQLAYPVETLLAPKDLDRLRVPPALKAAATAIDDTPAKDTVLPDVKAVELAQAQRRPMDLGRVPLVWAPSALLVDKPEKILTDDTPQAQETVVNGLLDLMRQAQREVLIISPYFVPGPQMMDVFTELRSRGVAVRVLTNSLASNDAPAAHAGYARHRPQLLRLGLEIHEMRAALDTAVGLEGRRASGSGFMGIGSGTGASKGGQSRASLHSKAVIIDRQVSVIGSMNLDLRSQLQNSEIALLIRGSSIAQQAARLIEMTISRSAYRVALDGGKLQWRAPAGAGFEDAQTEPEASWQLRWLVKLLGPFAPDEML